MKFGKFLPCFNNQFPVFCGLLSALSQMKIKVNFALSSHTKMITFLTVDVFHPFYKTVITSNVICLTRTEDLISYIKQYFLGQKRFKLLHVLSKYGMISQSLKQKLYYTFTLIRLGFFSIVFFSGRGGVTFEEELI